ncbi:MAG: DUF2161 family putative PD-(D/E)XK-type phosphodiesterase [Eubacteriales bacterium]|nr:DUF2161 family putative PD-(D/E)XK-type phosphodiesterase [Eubacteriales bacterium]
MKREKLLEKDLYEPVKAFLEQNGWKVQAEVMHCDVAAVRGDTLAVVEMKCMLNLEVILQATERQKTADLVYIAVPADCHPDGGRYKRICGLLRRLEIGLLEVEVNARRTKVHETLLPVLLDLEAAKRYARRRRDNMCREVLTRQNDYNTGGVTRTKIISVYREQAVEVALYLHENGPHSAAQVKAALGIARVYGIVHDNHYGWFFRPEKGIYAVTESGWGEAVEFAQKIAGKETDCADNWLLLPIDRRGR